MRTKNLRLFSALAAVIMILGSCGPEEPAAVEVTGITINQSSLSIARGGTANLTATVSPSNATDKTVTWSSSNPSVATVERGAVTAVGVGSATITAASNGRTATCQVTVTPKGVASIRLDKGSASMNIREVLTLVATVEPADADDKTVTWTSSDESVATVDNGTVTAVGKGEAVITASVGSLNVNCKVTVSYPVNSITLNKTEASVEEEKTVTLIAVVDTEDPDVNVIWTSENSGVASVDQNGLVKGLKVGTTTVTAKVGDKTATCAITVTEGTYKVKEREALVKFFNANNGANWSAYYKENWCSDKPLELWAGVEMTSDGKHVRSLWINDDNLKGQIPKEIADLTELEVLHLITKVRNAPTYSLPKEIARLKKLKDIYFHDYPISGKLPDDIFTMEWLEKLGINNASLSKWTIPASIANLKSLKELRLLDCNLYGSIPSAMGQLTGLEVLDLRGNDLTGTLPASLGSLINLKTLELDSNKLSGSIPTAVAKMDNYWRLWGHIFFGNNFTMDNLRASKVPSPRSPKVKTISGKDLDIEAEFDKHQYTVLFNLNPQSGDAVECLDQLASLYKANNSKGMGLITYFDNNSTGSDADTRDARFKEVINNCGATWDSFIRHMYGEYPDGAPFYAERGLEMYPHGVENSITIFGPEKTVVYSTLLDLSRESLNNAIAYLQTVFKTTISHYESKSYSDDGKVETLQLASVGKGVDLVVTGDAFSDRLISNGTFRNAAVQAVNDLFSQEPYKSMKNRFNIYLVKAVSKHEEYFNGNSTVFSGVFGYGSAVGGDDDKVLEYAKKAVGESRMDNVAVLVLMNSLRRGGTTYMMDPEDNTIYAGGASTCWVPFKDVKVTQGVSDLSSTIVHELGGHGIAKLADEYAYRDQGEVPTGTVTYVKNRQKMNWYRNVDFTSDPKKVLWSKFVGDSNFSSESIGAYEGGYTFWSGVWRPTEQSVMNDNYNHTTFNAPCRSLAWTRIMKLSQGESWTYDYNSFVSWDRQHPTVFRSATRSVVETDDNERVHIPPVVVGKTWRQVADGR